MTIVNLRKSHTEHLCATLTVCDVLLLLTFHFENLSQGRVAETLNLRHSMANINLHQSQKERFLRELIVFQLLYII